LRLVKFFLTDEELEELDEAADQADLARDAFATEMALAAARGTPPRVGPPSHEALVEVMAAAGLVRRFGANPNQAVARLNATGQRCEDLLPAQFCVQMICLLDGALKHARRSVP
jgi:hypothetical protein